jgi:hypothetical protein
LTPNFLVLITVELEHPNLLDISRTVLPFFK